MKQEMPELSLGRRLRALRSARNLSMRDLAASAGVSESFVSQVERGVANPSVVSLQRLAHALNTSIAALFEESDAHGRVVRASQRPRLVHPQRKWEDSLLTPRDSKFLQVILSVIEPGSGAGAPYAHESDEECVIVLKGSLEFRVGDESYLLEEGDSLVFESRLKHWNQNPGTSKAEVLWISTPPSY
jgi:transcriptional regulator with XRE-family HTH domain